MRQSPHSLLFALVAAGAFALSTLMLLVADFGTTGRVDRLRAENQALTQRIETLRSALARFNEDQDDVSSVIEELETELAEVRRNYANLGDTADNARQRLSVANERLDRLAEVEADNQRLSRENRELQERNDILVDRLQASRGEVERLRKEVNQQTEAPDAAIDIF